jgi:5-methylthioribose kinase
MKSDPIKFDAAFLIDVNNPIGLRSFLNANRHFEEGEKIEKLETAGEGNMNVVVRVITDRRSFIVKQSRPWVNKYPSVKAPADRILIEHEFYQTVQNNPIMQKFMPHIYCFDPSNFIMCIEDFGKANDFSSIYRKGVEMSKKDMADVSSFISELHFAFKDPQQESRIVNMEMRKLNHEHIFVLPLLQHNGFDLDGVLNGLQDATHRFRTDDKLKACARELGDVYLSDSGSRLLHGDYYPGSWLSTSSGFKMIDPEFCFTGRPEFELGVTIAHLKMAQQPDSLIKDLFVYYHFDGRFDGSLMSKFAGMEMIRRLIGLAQLPLELSLEERLELLDTAYDLVVNG